MQVNSVTTKGRGTAYFTLLQEAFTLASGVLKDNTAKARRGGLMVPFSKATSFTEKKHGRGRFEWASGCRYEGEFDANDMHGDGVYMWSDGRGYSGQWVRNAMAPTGTMWWSDGRVYEGEFREGVKSGSGS